MADWQAVIDAVTVALTGDKEQGRDRLTACWADTTDTDHAQRCVIAHYLADLQASLDDEVAWDEAALAAHAQVSDADLAPVGIASAAAMAASLHLNLGDGYARQGRVEAARAQLDAGKLAGGALPADGYGAMVRAGLDRLGDRIDGAQRR